jgi:hypothetical protein
MYETFAIKWIGKNIAPRVGQTFDGFDRWEIVHYNTRIDKGKKLQVTSGHPVS